MDVSEKLRILADAAKYDVACTSSGSSRKGARGGLGNTVAAGLCHSFAADGRCVSLLKVLMTNYCVNDCKYCQSRNSNDIPRAMFTPEELADLTISFYRRNYIEGLFLSSGIVRSPDYTTELMCRTISLLRFKHRFNGYIHAKAIPGTSPELIEKLGSLIDRISVNIELPSESSLKMMAPQKTKRSILAPMTQIRNSITENTHALTVYRHAQPFAPAGQSTQMIVGASPETDYQILRLSSSLYKQFAMKRVFYSSYIPVGDSTLPALPAPMLREHRLYQADWLLRFYEFETDEILSADSPMLDMRLDPKCDWALRNLGQFPVEINKADYHTLLRVPGIGVVSARRILSARRSAPLCMDTLKKLGIVIKRAQYFITCGGRMAQGVLLDHDFIYQNLVYDYRKSPPQLGETRQCTLFDDGKLFLQGGQHEEKLCLYA